MTTKHNHVTAGGETVKRESKNSGARTRVCVASGEPVTRPETPAYSVELLRDAYVLALIRQATRVYRPSSTTATQYPMDRVKPR